MLRKRLSTTAYLDGIRNGDRLVLSQAITLIESNLPTDRAVARELLTALQADVPQGTLRIGITGVPGAGKSTFIEAFGSLLTAQKKKVAVLSVDPTSTRTKGSILGDKTRMDNLAHNPLAFIRPSPTRGSLGGVTHSTAETILLCEAAGYEIILIETVGVGQSETTVRNMVDFFLLLLLPGAGDELQGIKRGIVEMADALVINKADADPLKAQQAQVAYQNALHLFPPAPSGWLPTVLMCAAITSSGLSEIWETITQFQAQLTANNYWQKQRQEQRINRMHHHIQKKLLSDFYESPQVTDLLHGVQNHVRNGEMHPITAAENLLEDYRTKSSKNL